MVDRRKPILSEHPLAFTIFFFCIFLLIIISDESDDYHQNKIKCLHYQGPFGNEIIKIGLIKFSQLRLDEFMNITLNHSIFYRISDDCQ